VQRGELGTAGGAHRQALRPAEERAYAGVDADRHPAHGRLEVGRHPVPVRRQLAEGEVGGNPVDLPRRADRLEEPDHEPAALLPEVAEARRILQHGQRAVDALDRLGDEVVVLGGLQRDIHADALAELAGPHAGAVDDVLRLDVTLRRAYAAHRTAAGEEPGRRHPLQHGDPAHPGPLGQRHGGVDRVDPAVLGDIEAGQHVVGAGGREELLDLARGDLVNVDAAVPVECGHPAVLLQPARFGGELDEAHLLQAGGEPGLRLQPGEQVAGVEPHLGGGLRGGPEGDHEPGRVPGGAAGEPVAFQQHHVGPAQVRQVVGDGRADDPAAHDDDAGALRKCHAGPLLWGVDVA
jgi:hypothetical protein